MKNYYSKNMEKEFCEEYRKRNYLDAIECFLFKISLNIYNLICSNKIVQYFQRKRFEKNLERMNKIVGDIFMELKSRNEKD